MSAGVMGDVIQPLLGGVLIGLAAALLHLGVGRVAGISGIFAGIAQHRGSERRWRLAFFGGLAAAGSIAIFFWPSSFEITQGNGNLQIVIAGLLVGFGTRLGSGCTSGHGVCGVSRLSKRSIVATLCFIASGALTVGLL